MLLHTDSIKEELELLREEHKWVGRLEFSGGGGTFESLMEAHRAVDAEIAYAPMKSESPRTGLILEALRTLTTEIEREYLSEKGSMFVGRMAVAHSRARFVLDNLDNEEGESPRHWWLPFPEEEHQKGDTK